MSKKITNESPNVAKIDGSSDGRTVKVDLGRQEQVKPKQSEGGGTQDTGARRSRE